MPTVAIVGRPNVGKSTLFNRIVGRRDAVVDAVAGVTRDRKSRTAAWNGRRFHVVDTGGWLAAERGAGESLDAKVTAQSELAMADADVALLVVDVTVGVTEDDARVAALLRRLDVATVVVANKADTSSRDHDSWEFVSLGLGEPWRASALHGRLVADLLDHVVGLLPPEQAADAAPAEQDGSAAPPAEQAAAAAPAADPPLFTAASAAAGGIVSVSIVGRPNVGKSTLFNRLIGSDRSVVHDVPGTTRDAIDTVVETELGPIRFVDTAGLRRKARVDADAEYYANLRALRSIDTADVALLVVDATTGVTQQDQRLAERIDAVGSPVLVLLNKWEVVSADDREQVTAEVGRRLHFIGAAPVLRISALTGRGVHRLLPAIEVAVRAYELRIPTSKVNDALRRAQSATPAPRGARVLYATQGATHPPTFTLFVNREMPPTYLRYLERCLRTEFDLGATPLKLHVRRR
ncbi:MAG TPA: ribosome biogenesis GTPase Der [Acidimicrobiaceae bacterium]|nr:ribosome biogenesis GTPase Der [Acidimicrobiaceae bacterium]HCB37746.1 ribosome biogenesis GTPase Der [Acidimicrobiaceae bacterium]